MLSQFPPRITLANLPTPLRALTHLSSTFENQTIWLKSDDQSGFALGGNKVRKLEFLLADAIAKGADTVITCGGIQSNHCRATAFACAQLGLKCHLILRNDLGPSERSSAGQANHFLDMLCGATVELHSVTAYQSELDAFFVQATARIAESGGCSYAIPTGGSNGLGVWGYVNAATEILTQSAEQGFTPSVVVCASGSGGTQAGLALGMLLSGSECRVVGFAVCDSSDYFEEKIRCDIRECAELSGLPAQDVDALLAKLNLHCNDKYIGPGYARASPELYDTIAHIAKTDGVLLDPVYTGKAFHGMLSELNKDVFAHDQHIVFVHTGGAFGLFPHADKISFTRCEEV